MFNLMDSLTHSLGRNFTEALQIILSVTAVAAIVGGIIQWFILSHKSWETSVTVSLWFTSIITGFFFLFILYVVNYGKDQFVFFPAIGFTLMMFILCFAGMLFFNYGIEILIQHNSAKAYNKTHAIIWLAVVAGTPVLCFLYSTSQTLVNHVGEINTALALVNVAHDAELPLYLTEIKFINSKNKAESHIKINDKDMKAFKQDEDEKIDLEQEQKLLNQDLFSERSELPIGSDQLVLSWYSFVENKYYTGTYPLSYENFNLKTTSFPMFGQTQLQPIYIKLKLDGKMDLLTYNKRQTYLLNQYSAANVAALPNDQLELLTTRYFAEEKPEPNQLANAQQSLAEKSLRQSRLFNWSLKFEWLDKTTTGIFITDLNQTEQSLIDGSGVDFAPKVLPIEIDLRDDFSKLQYAHINLFLDTKILFHMLDNTEPNEQIVFTIKVGDVLKEEVQFLVKTKTQEVEMTDIKKEINIYDL